MSSARMYKEGRWDETRDCAVVPDKAQMTSPTFNAASCFQPTISHQNKQNFSGGKERNFFDHRMRSYLEILIRKLTSMTTKGFPLSDVLRTDFLTATYKNWRKISEKPGGNQHNAWNMKRNFCGTMHMRSFIAFSVTCKTCTRYLLFYLALRVVLTSKWWTMAVCVAMQTVLSVSDPNPKQLSL